MLHEILFALLGHTGSIIIELPPLDSAELSKNLLSQAENGIYNNRQIRFMVNPNLNFLSRAEVEIQFLFSNTQLYKNDSS